MAVPDDFTREFPATISDDGEENGVLISLPRPGSNEQQSVGIYGTYGTAVLVIEARQLGMQTFFPIGVYDTKALTAAGTGGSISLTDDTSYLFTFNAGNYDAICVYASALGTGSIQVEQASGPYGGQPINVVASSGASAAGTTTITSTSTSALAVGANGATNPVFSVNAATGSVATGITVIGAAAAGGVAVNVISSGSDENVKYDAKGAGTVTIGSVSTGNVVLGTSGHTLTLNNSSGAVTLAAGGLTLTSGSILASSGNLTLTSGNATLTAGNLLLSAGTATVTSANASAFAVGRLGATTPGLVVDASTSTCITGIKVTPKGTGNGVAIASVGETNVAITLDGNGSGTISLNATGTGGVIVGSSTGRTLTMAGTLTSGGLVTAAVQICTAGPLIYSGSGAPSISAAVKGSLYLCSNGSSTSTRLYVASDNAGTWVAVTTAS